LTQPGIFLLPHPAVLGLATALRKPDADF